ncbi:unnamed protein product [Durusdinium trenchii]|uniref:Uncharacterized protein n=1 Tax=Durusdinium trenchii TaxID=1381693 RepID=A0ABP0M5B4_9DINO
MEKTMAKCAKHGAAAQMLTAYNTIPFDLDDLFRTVETCYNDSTCQLVEKVENQANLFAKNILAMKLPKYNDDSNIEEHEKDKQLLSCQKVAEASNLVSKIKSFLAAVQKCCVEIAGLEPDMSEVKDALDIGRLFVYSFTVVTILHSPLWKTVTPEAVNKKDSRAARLVEDLNFALKSVKNDRIALPDSLLARSTEMLKRAGIEVDSGQ